MASIIEVKAGSKKIGDFLVGKTIGQGTFGKVKEGIHMPSGHKVAIKILQKSRINIRDDLARVHNELKILYKKVDHPNIIKLLELHESPTHVYIITEFIQGQELYQLIVQKGSLDPHLCGIYFCQILQAIQYLHSIGVCHRDIKPENIMVNGESLKLIDFGLSKQFDYDCLLKTSCGSPCYAAPEMLKGGHYNCVKSDIWAMGVTLYAMAAGHLPYEDENTDRLYQLIDTQPLEPIISMPQNRNFSRINTLCPYILSHSTSISLINLLLEKILQKDPHHRIETKQMKDNIWVRQWQSYLKSNQLEYENDDILLSSMSEYFQKSVTQIRQILKSKSIMSICTYYFLNRKLKQTIFPSLNSVVVESQLVSQENSHIARMRQQKERFYVGTPVKQTNLQNNPQSSLKKPSFTHQKYDSAYHDKIIQSKLKSQSVVTCLAVNSSNSKINGSAMENLYTPDPQHNVLAQNFEEPQVHCGSFHVSHVFGTLEEVYRYANNELSGKFQYINYKIQEEEEDQCQDLQDGEDNGEFISKYCEFNKNQMENDLYQEQEYICFNNKYILRKNHRKSFEASVGKMLKESIKKGQTKKPKKNQDIVQLDKYTLELKGVRMKIKVLQNSSLYYLDMPSYFVS